MLDRSSRWALAFGLVMIGAAVTPACGGTVSSTGDFNSGGADSGSSGKGSGAGAGSGTGAGHSGSSGTFVGSTGTGTQHGLDVEPKAQQTIAVTAGQTTPTVTYNATLDGNLVNVGWGVDKGNVGTVAAGPSSTTTFTPTGSAGGLVTVSAGFNGTTVNRQVLVKLTAKQNGGDPTNPAEQAQFPSSVGALKNGGGVGGVGGEGLGGAVDPATLTALGSPAGNGQAQGLAFLYPYDKTVWPRGMLAPLLQWTSALGDADAVQIEITSSTGSFSYTGTFGRPAILAQTGGPFIRHPIPQDIWDMATNTAGGADMLKLRLTVAKGGVAYGPITETWTVAAARLSGTIYYNSYGTQLAQNYGGALGGNGTFGGAVLSIHVGDTGPKLVAGSSGGVGQCRVCHSVAAFGSRLVVSQGQAYSSRSEYDLSPTGAVETGLNNQGPWFPAVYPDGSMMLTSDAQLLPLPNDGTPLPATGLPAAPNMPAFSPDGKLVAFNASLGTQLTVMNFDSTTSAFTSPTIVVDAPGGLTPGWPAFFPDGKSVVFEQESAASLLDGDSSGILWTRSGAKGQIAWTSTTTSTKVTPLDQLNGKGYLPTIAAPVPILCNDDAGHEMGGVDADHGDDVDVNYEPTVNPVASGGYAWVVFTSRRMYGSMATIPPFCSDPRGIDLVTNITPKKLWVAAIDLDGKPGADASHPAFYLPAQELVAGNSRGFWALDPCKSDGDSCATGDQCCGGFCEPSGSGGALVCSNTPPGGTCSKPQEKCTTAADCCDPKNACVNGFCSQKGPA